MSTVNASRLVDKALNARALANDLTKEVIKDRSISLEERWELFEKAREVLEVEPWIHHDIFKKFDLEFNDFYGDYNNRGETIYFDNLRERLEELDDEDDYYPHLKALDKNEVLEAILENGTAGFVFDW